MLQATILFSTVSSSEVPPEVAELEAAVVAKYSVAPDAAKASSKEDEVTAVQPSSLNVRKLDKPAEINTAPVGEFAWESSGAAAPEVQPKSSLNVRKSEESSMDAWPVEGVEVASVQPSSLNVRRLDKPAETHTAPVGEFAWESTAAETSEAAQQSSSNMLKLGEPTDIPKAPVSDFAWESTAEVAQAEVPLTSPAKFTLKKPQTEVTPEENPSEPSLSAHLSPPVQEENIRRSKKMVMHDMPHYRNHGAAMYHVEPTARKTGDRSTSSRTPQQEAAAAEHAKQLAEKRAEVENVFHLSKAAVEHQPESDTSADTGCSLLRSLFLCAALLMFGVIAYHKYEVIYQLSAGKHGPQKFKAKDEDMGGFAEPPQSSQHASEGLLTCMVASGRSTLTRRGAGQSRDSLPLPF